LKIFFLLIFFNIFLISYNYADAEISFEDVSNKSGINNFGESWGSAWGDFNNDSFPDLWITNHLSSPILYENNGDGTFTDVSEKFNLQNFDGIDKHGSSWADFDNDGDQDLIVLVGAKKGIGEGPNLFFINHLGLFEEKASELGVDYPLGRGRTPLWFDYNHDGYLDLLLVNAKRFDGKSQTTLLQQNSSGFQDVTSLVGLNFTKTTLSAQLSNFVNTKNLDLIFIQPYYPSVYDVYDVPFQKIELKNFPKTAYNDLVIGDFNNDMTPEIILVNAPQKSIVTQINSTLIRAMIVSNNNEVGFTFNQSGNIFFSFSTSSKIFIGADSASPSSNAFTISSEDIQFHGFPTTENLTDEVFHVGYNPSNNEWKVLQSSKNYTTTNIVIKSDNPISNIVPINYNSSRIFGYDKLVLLNQIQFDELISDVRLLNPTSCNSIVAGDFDNDMDLDIYLNCSLVTKNLPNILYENKGDGNFTIVSNAGGAEGSTLGIGDSVTMADYNMDGFLDLFVTNGHLRNYAYDGPNQLFRNQGNDNHWIEIDLVGTVSNRDAIGSLVVVNSDEISQYREQNGGIHSDSQNHKRIHFGLGENTSAEKIIVYWPSGLISEMNNVNADQILEIIEPTIPLPPRKQISLGIEPHYVLCKDGLNLILKPDGNAVCVKQKTMEILTQRGWNIPLTANPP